ncbi:hypothetical protein TNCV_4041641, partial [Trichonephila clavipes]
ELDKFIKEGSTPMQPIRLEAMPPKVQKETSHVENAGRRVGYFGRTNSYLMNIKPTSVESKKGQFLRR